MIQYLLTIFCSRRLVIRRIIINGEETLRKILRLLPKETIIQEIITKNDILYEDDYSFLQELKEDQKPYNMEFGNKN